MSAVESFCPVPKPLPDELVFGHLGRILMLNSIPDSISVPCALANLVGMECKPSANMNYLALLSGMPLGMYMFSHTLAPFHCAVQSQGRISWASANLRLHRGMTSERRGTVHAARFCPQCVAIDVESKAKMSYWRRSHQLPGVSWCPVHHCSLMTVAEDAPLSHFPEAVKDAQKADERAEEFAANPVIRRYGEVCLGLLSRDASISTKQITQVIQARARVLNLRSRPGVLEESHLDKLAIEQVSPAWLNDNFPDVFTRGSSSSICRTYSSLKKAYAAQYYAFALALLFDSAEDALLALRQADEQLVAQSSVKQAISDFMSGLPLLQAIEKNGLALEGVEGALRASLLLAQ